MLHDDSAWTARLCADTLAVIMAGGRGERLGALTRWHCKPALPFGGKYRNIDFPLSNCINSGIRRIGLLTQYNAHSLIRHCQHYCDVFRSELGEFLDLWPAQLRPSRGWYQGTADAVYQNLDVIQQHTPSSVLVLAGDHVYKMNYARMVETHASRGADVTVGCVEVPIEAAREFGVIGVDGAGHVRTFLEKPTAPPPMPGRQGTTLVSMGVYVFNAEFLLECLAADAHDKASGHDFGHDLLPAMIGGRARVLAHRFEDEQTGGQGYWRDVGTLDRYWEANMDLLVDEPALDLRDPAWPIRTRRADAAPPVLRGRGQARRSILSTGCLVAGDVNDSVLCTGCEVGDGSEVANAVILPSARIGRNCRIARAVVDSGCVIPDNTVIGEDLFPSTEGAAETVLEVSSRGISLVSAPIMERAVPVSRSGSVAA